MGEIHPELIGAIAAGVVTSILAIIAAVRQKRSPGLRDLSHVDGMGPESVLREILITELRAEVAQLKTDLATSERRGILMMERLVSRDD